MGWVGVEPSHGRDEADSKKYFEFLTRGAQHLTGNMIWKAAVSLAQSYIAPSIALVLNIYVVVN